MTSGERIKKARKKAGMTQQQLADALGVNFSVISQYEHDRRNPKLETIRKIAAAIGVSDRELMGDYEYDSNDEPQMNEILSAENWNRWVDKNMKPVFSSRAEFEEWTKNIDPTDPPLLTDFFLADEGQQKKARSVESGLDEDAKELLDNYNCLNPEGKEVLLNTSRGLVASGQYKKGLKASNG